MAEQKAEPQEYITDGLIFWLDGYDATSNSWVDKIGNRTFTLYNCAVSNHGVVFNGSSSYGECLTTNIAGQTIEGVFINNNTSALAAIFHQKSTKTEQNIMLTRNAAGVIYTRATDSNVTQCKYAQQGVETTSAYQDGSFAIVNGNEAPTNLGNQAQATVAGKLMLGNRIGRTNWLNGTIYAVRIYNRLLTKSEILHNQHIDNTRFNLGVF